VEKGESERHGRDTVGLEGSGDGRRSGVEDEEGGRYHIGVGQGEGKGQE